MPKVELSNYKGREQAYVKHCLLEKYLSQWSYIVGRGWDSLAYVDGFAGPWGSQGADFEDASFGIATRVINDAVDGLHNTHQRSIRALCAFVEKKPNAFVKLDAFAKAHSTPRVKTIALHGRFVENIPKIESEIAGMGKNPFKFVFLDQKGWAATPIAKLKPFLSKRSCEVLFNLMTSFLTRFVDEESRESSYAALFGRSGVLEKIRALPKGTGEREHAAVREYCKSLKEICGFQYVAQAVIMDPEKEKVRYHLVFATNSLRGVEVFKTAEMEAAEIQDDVRHQSEITRTGQPELSLIAEDPKSRLTRTTRSQYLGLMRKKVLSVVEEANGPVGYDGLFGEAMAFPLVTPEDLVQYLKELEPSVTLILNGPSRRKPSPGKDDRVLINRGTPTVE